MYGTYGSGGTRRWLGVTGAEPAVGRCATLKKACNTKTRGRRSRASSCPFFGAVWPWHVHTGCARLLLLRVRWCPFNAVAG